MYHLIYNIGSEVEEYMSKQVTVEWLVNHMIHNWHEVVFIKSIYQAGEWKETILCKWDDNYYQNHKQEIYEWKISFISINNETIKVFVEVD